MSLTAALHQAFYKAMSKGVVDSLSSRVSNPYWIASKAAVANGIDGMRFCGLEGNEPFLNNGTCPNLDLSCTNCDFQAYGIRMAQLGGAPIALGILCFLVSLILIFVICCNCCVKKCAPKNGEKVNNRVCIYIFVAICLGLAGVGLVITFTGNDSVGRGVNSIAETVIGGINEASSRLGEIKQAMQSNNYTNDAQAIATVDSAIGLVANMSQQVREVRTLYVDRFESVRSGALVAGAVFPPAAIAFGLLLFCCGIRGCVGLVAWIAMAVVILVWFSLGVHVAVSEATNDICFEVDLLIDEANVTVSTSQQNNVTSSSSSFSFAGVNVAQSPLVLLMQCKTGRGSPLEGLNTTITNAINSAINVSCDAINQICSQNVNGEPVVDCGSPYTCNLSYILSFQNRTVNDTVFICADNSVQSNPNDCPGGLVVANPSVRRSISDCATRCNNTRLRSTSGDIVSGTASLRLFLATIDKVLSIMNCQFVADAFFSIKDQICLVFTAGMKQIYSGNALQAISLVVASIVFVVAHHSVAV